VWREKTAVVGGPTVDSYRVAMRLQYRARGGHINIEVRAANNDLLRPWQAYAHHWLTGGYAFYASCADGFAAGEVKGTPEASVGLFLDDNWISMDPESAAEKGVRQLSLSFTCNRGAPSSRELPSMGFVLGKNRGT